MIGSDRSFSSSTLYAAARRAEIEAQIAEIRRARQATAGRRLRHRVGQALIALGETLSEWRLEPAPVQPRSTGVRQGRRDRAPLTGPLTHC